MVGHKEGVWCINYNKDGSQLVTASPEGIAKLWDPKSGKAQVDLIGHTKRVTFLFSQGINNYIGILGNIQQCKYSYCNMWQ
jgi:WD40 repeat protein